MITDRLTWTVVGDPAQRKLTGNPGGGGLSGLLVDLVSWWTLNESSGTRADSHGSNDLADNNTVASAAGKQGNAASFTAANNEWLSVNSPTGIVTSGDFTVAGWFYVDTVAWIPVLFNYAQGSGGLPGENDMAGYVNTGGTVEFWITDGTSYFTAVGPVVSTGQWHFGVFIHTVATKNIKVSVNNGTFSDATYTGTIHQGSTDFKLGKYHNLAPTRIMDGDMDEWAFWTRALPDDEIALLYNGGNGVSYSDLS